MSQRSCLNQRSCLGQIEIKEVPEQEELPVSQRSCWAREGVWAGGAVYEPERSCPWARGATRARGATWTAGTAWAGWASWARGGLSLLSSLIWRTYKHNSMPTLNRLPSGELQLHSDRGQRHAKKCERDWDLYLSQLYVVCQSDQTTWVHWKSTFLPFIIRSWCTCYVTADNVYVKAHITWSCIMLTVYSY